MNDVKQEEAEDTEHEMTADELHRHEAAVKILSCCRGFLARQRVEALRFNIYFVRELLSVLHDTLFFTFIAVIHSLS